MAVSAVFGVVVRGGSQGVRACARRPRRTARRRYSARQCSRTAQRPRAAARRALYGQSFEASSHMVAICVRTLRMIPCGDPCRTAAARKSSAASPSVSHWPGRTPAAPPASPPTPPPRKASLPCACAECVCLSLISSWSTGFAAMQTCARDVDVAVSAHATAATPQRSASSNDCTGAQCPQCASLSQPCGAQLAAANANACAESKDCPDRFFCAAEADGAAASCQSLPDGLPPARRSRQVPRSHPPSCHPPGCLAS